MSSVNYYWTATHQHGLLKWCISFFRETYHVPFFHFHNIKQTFLFHHQIRWPSLWDLRPISYLNVEHWSQSLLCTVIDILIIFPNNVMNISLKNAKHSPKIGRINCSHVMTFPYKFFAQITIGSFFCLGDKKSGTSPVQSTIPHTCFNWLLLFVKITMCSLSAFQSLFLKQSWTMHTNTRLVECISAALRWEGQMKSHQSNKIKYVKW